jgi:hypothetical protein
MKLQVEARRCRAVEEGLENELLLEYREESQKYQAAKGGSELQGVKRRFPQLQLDSPPPHLVRRVTFLALD